MPPTDLPVEPSPPSSPNKPKRRFSVTFIVIVSLLLLPILGVTFIVGTLFFSVKSASHKSKTHLDKVVNVVKPPMGCQLTHETSRTNSDIDTVEAKSVRDYTCPPATGDAFITAFSSTLAGTSYRIEKASAQQPVGVAYSQTTSTTTYGYNLVYDDAQFTNISVELDDTPGQIYTSADKDALTKHLFSHLRITITYN